MYVVFLPGKINVNNDPKGKQHAEAKAFFATARIKETNTNSASTVNSFNTVSSIKRKESSTASKIKVVDQTRLTVSGETIKMSSKSWLQNLKDKHGVVD